MSARLKETDDLRGTWITTDETRVTVVNKIGENWHGFEGLVPLAWDKNGNSLHMSNLNLKRRLPDPTPYVIGQV